MAWVSYAAFGAFGGLAVEAVRLLSTLDRINSGKEPVRQHRLRNMLLSAIIRVFLGAGTAIVMASTGQINGPFGAFWIGLSAPLLIEQLGQRTPISTMTQPSSPIQRPTESTPADNQLLTDDPVLRPVEIPIKTATQSSVREIDDGVWESTDRPFPTAAKSLFLNDQPPSKRHRQLYPSTENNLLPDFSSRDNSDPTYANPVEYFEGPV